MNKQHNNIAGALFEFIGYLSTRETQTVLSAYDCPGYVLNELQDFANIYDLQLKNADVENWQQSLDDKNPFGWMIHGSSRVYFGKYAEMDAKKEAKQCGGMCEAFPIYC